jgi:AraC-like DNA-binding protein
MSALLLPKAAHFLTDVISLPITVLSEIPQFDQLQRQYQFHAQQKYLSAASLQSLFASLTETNILLIDDMYQIHFILAIVSGVPVVLGPYCTEMLTQADCIILLQRNGLSTNLATDLAIYRNAFPISKSDDVRHALAALRRYVDRPVEHTEMRYLHYGDSNSLNEAANIRKPYDELIDQRYRLETQFMQAIMTGDSSDALKHWHSLHRSVAHLKALGQTLEQARIAAAVNRTTIRIAAIRVGLPATINDQLTRKSAAIIQKAATIDAINHEHERLIREFCTLIYNMQHHSYSPLVLSILYYFKHNYHQQIDMASLAFELNITPTYLARRFKQETGLSPSHFLRRLRLDHAAKRLSYSEESIQDIAASIGILDPNYFSKIFLQKFDETPSSYRKHHSI